MTPEGKIKNWLVNQLQERLSPGLELYKPPGGPFGKAGEPDIHGCYGGCMFVIEVKAEHMDPSPLQWARLRRYIAAGALCMVIRGRDLVKVETLVKMIKERAECLKPIIGQQSQA